MKSGEIPQEFVKASIGLCTVYNDNEIYLGKQMTYYILLCVVI